MAELVEEKWKPIQGYEGLYECSNYGHIKSVRRSIILRGFPNKNNGYHQVMLYDKEGHNKLCYTHIIVAKTWLPEPLNGETLVMHISGNKMNNGVWNLMWKCSSIKKNIELAIPDGRIALCKNKEYAYIVNRYNLNGVCLSKYKGFDILEMMGYKKKGIMTAAKTQAKYKNYKWSIEKVD